MADTPSVPNKDVARIRQVLARELETISEYEELARAAESADVRAFFLHLAEEEKEHVAEAVYLLGRFDSGQAAQYAKDFSGSHFLGGAKPPSDLAAPGGSVDSAQAASAGTSTSGGFTVSGSESKDGYLPPGHHLPADPHRVIHALPAPPSPRAGVLTVGPLKGTRP